MPAPVVVVTADDINERPAFFEQRRNHTVAAERSIADAPEGVVVETVHPGFRTSHGVILAKAGVAVNRRP